MLPPSSSLSLGPELFSVHGHNPFRVLASPFYLFLCWCFLRLLMFEAERLEPLIEAYYSRLLVFRSAQISLVAYEGRLRVLFFLFSLDCF